MHFSQLHSWLGPGTRKQCEAVGAAISKGHLLLSHHFSKRQYLLKLYCMDTQLLVAIMGRKTSTLILNNFIRCTMLRAQNKISKRMYMADLALILQQLVKIKQRLLKHCLKIVKNSNSCE